LNILSSLIPGRRPLALTKRQTECVEDGLLWALNCLAGFAPPPVRGWVANKQSDFADFRDVEPTAIATCAEMIWARLGLTASLGSTHDQTAIDASLYVGARLIALSDQRPPVWWSGTSKAAHMLTLVLGLGFVFGKPQLEALSPGRVALLLSSAEVGYALALISEYSGVEPKSALIAGAQAVREGYQAGLSHLNRNHDLRNDLQVLTDNYDRQMLRR